MILMLARIVVADADAGAAAAVGTWEMALTWQ